MQEEEKIANSKADAVLDYIPISPELISHVRRIDGFNDEQLMKLKMLLTSVARRIEPSFDFDKEESLQRGTDLRKFIEMTLRVHQIFALVDVDFAKVMPPSGDASTRDAAIGEHLADITKALVEHNGLNYSPRPRSIEGRMFEQAADSRVLIDHLQAISPIGSGAVDEQIHYFVHIMPDAQSGEEGEGSPNEKEEQALFSKLNISIDNVILDVSKPYIELLVNSNGKADLYFHGYFWQQYLQSLLDLEDVQGDQNIFNMQKYPFMARLIGLASTLTRVIVNIAKFPFNEKIYQKYANEFGKKQKTRKSGLMEEIQRALFVAQISDDTNALAWIEKLLIQLQGYYEMTIRDQAIVLLNMLYDGVDWQLQEAFRPVIRCVGQHFVVSIITQKSPESQNKQLFLGLGAPSPIKGNNSHILAWHKVEERNIEQIENNQQRITLNFGKFWKCGFYDWRLVQVGDDGKLLPQEIFGKNQPVFPTQVPDDYYEEGIEEEVGCIAQGRFIVHSKGFKEQSFHEVQVDFQDAEIDKARNMILRRGHFGSVANNIEKYAKQGITSLYLMGALERDNYPQKTPGSSTVDYRKDDASPLASVERSMVNKMLGGEQEFKKLMATAKSNNVKIITDCLARISSSRHHRKYKDLLLRYLDEDGRIHLCYGTDGQAQKFEDTAMLNYRKKEAWDMLIDEVLSFSKKYGIDGIHLDNGQAWPQIMEPDMEELQRLDVDDEPLYTPQDILNGEIVIRNENFGYWNSNNMETYPNPFFIKLCKRLWFENPDFMIISECWGGLMFENRQIILARSGIVPRMYKLPMAISQLFGKNLHKDGRVETTHKDNVLAIKQWYDDSRKFLPEGTIMLQSSTAHSLPYPAYMYGKGTWAAIDILFFMPDIPITFMNELEGEIYKLGQQQTVFQQEQSEVNQPGQLKRTNSQIMRAMLAEQTISGETSTPEQRRGLPRVRSGANISQNYVEASDGKIDQKERVFKQQMDSKKGFDLSQINQHYTYRRMLRREKMVLRYGNVIHLSAKDADGNFVPDILVYARFSLMETIIIATSLSDHYKKFVMDLSQLLPTINQAYNNSTVITVTNLMSETKEEEYYFLREYIELNGEQSLPPYRSLLISIKICQDDETIYNKSVTNSINRTIASLKAGQSIENEQISLLFTDCIKYKPNDIHRFANVIGSIQSSLLDKLKISFRELCFKNTRLIQNPEMSGKLMAMTGYIMKNAGGQMIPCVRAAQSVHESNSLGPIVFCTPELGRWSTVGGLGVMVDELSVGLAELGQDVIVISPYYERNRKGQTGYLQQDPAGIHYKDNIRVDIGGGHNLGVHEGVVKGVKVVFLHNSDVFPSPYPDSQPGFLVNQISVFGKACLEYLCQRQIIPSVCITNDWFTGFIPGYAKSGHFGDTFRGSCFLHICHNLQELYEGRIYLNPVEGSLDHVHQLPRDWLIDNSWKTLMINPSRCALMVSDQWATVSKSYRDDLLNSSSLCNILRQKPQPFAFPNGIPIKERLKKLNQAAPDHLAAKKQLQIKYFHFGDLDDSVPLLAFVGRVTAQKGVHLILDVAEHIIRKFDFKVQILVGGPANMSEKYAASCAHKMWELRNKFPHCFWAAPDEFFTDGALVNRGADFGLMPSLFEPGGIVQHEFFVGSTPVVAFKTGGLKDSVIEYLWDSETGCGYTFENHSPNDFIFAIERAIGTFRNKQKYLKLRENAFKATMDGEIVSKAWLGEFYRLRGKNYSGHSFNVSKELEKTFPPWRPAEYASISLIQEIFGEKQKQTNFVEIDHGATEGESTGTTADLSSLMSEFDKIAFNKRPHMFKLHNHGPQHQKVELCGSFDDWKVRHDMRFDQITKQWFINLHLKTGEEYLYKYIINDSQWVVNHEESRKKDAEGNENNFISLTY